MTETRTGHRAWSIVSGLLHSSAACVGGDGVLDGNPRITEEAIG
jgi:hypothetical protein